MDKGKVKLNQWRFNQTSPEVCVGMSTMIAGARWSSYSAKTKWVLKGKKTYFFSFENKLVLTHAMEIMSEGNFSANISQHQEVWKQHHAFLMLFCKGSHHKAYVTVGNNKISNDTLKYLSHGFVLIGTAIFEFRYWKKSLVIYGVWAILQRCV